MITTDLWLCMVQAWAEVYAPIAQIGVVGMVAVAVLMGAVILVVLVLRNYLSGSAHLPI